MSYNYITASWSTLLGVYSFAELLLSFLDLWKEGRKEGNVLFNEALNTFYLRLYGIRHMVEDHSSSKIANLLLSSHRLLFLINNKGFYMHHPTDKITHTMNFVISVVEHWLE